MKLSTFLLLFTLLVTFEAFLFQQKLAALGKTALGLETGYNLFEKTSSDFGKETSCKLHRPRKLQIDTETHLVVSEI